LKVQVFLLSFLTGFSLFLACSEEAKVWCEKLNIQYRVEAVRESKVNQTTPKRYEDNFRFLNVKLESSCQNLSCTLSFDATNVVKAKVTNINHRNQNMIRI
jgi:hypothetical protein